MTTTALPDTLCHLNGETLPLRDAKISVLDRGFIFGDGIYEVIPVYGRRCFRFDEHMARLARSLDKLRIPNPHSRDGWLALVRELVAAQPADDQLVYIEITRGVALRDHVMPVGITPTVFAMTSPMKPPSAEQRHQGVACVTARDFRWERGDIKSVSLLGNVLARQISADHGALETVMFRDGWLTEASGSNVWVVHEGALLGPPKSGHVLEGIRVRPAGRAVRRSGHRLQPAPHLRERRARRRRADPDLGHQGGAARHPARRRAGGPRRAARQARPGVRPPVRGLPARQA
jgi:D-alanine transaminase